jgi:actin-related protein
MQSVETKLENEISKDITKKWVKNCLKCGRSKQKEKDLIRQNKIINILKPKKFWRYDVINKQFRNVLEGNS